MSADEAAAVVSGIRGAVQDFLAPEVREMRADLRANTRRLEDVRAELREWRLSMDKRFERIEHQLDTYRDAQSLKEQMAELRARQQPSA
jgi:hypothetical protein